MTNRLENFSDEFCDEDIWNVLMFTYKGLDKLHLPQDTPM